MPAITPPHYLASLYLSLSSLYSSKPPAYGQNSTPSPFSPLFFSPHTDHMFRHAFGTMWLGVKWEREVAGVV